MWIERVELVTDQDASCVGEVGHEDPDWQSLSERASDVRDFVLGVTDLDLEDYANPNARFIDAQARVHRVKRHLPSSSVLGVATDGFSVDREEFIRTGDTAISIFGLVKSAGNHTSKQSIIWTMTWLLNQSEWRILNSHASRN